MPNDEIQEALIYLMVSMAAADGAITDKEIHELCEAVQRLPVFEGATSEHVRTAARECTKLLEGERGIDAIIEMVKLRVPPRLRETAYALAIEIAAADVDPKFEELQYLALLRDELEIERLAAGAIEHSARVRYRRL